MLDLESSDDWSMIGPEDDDPDFDRHFYHIQLLCDEGLMVKNGRFEYRLTASGHDFLDATRTEGIWKKAKEGGAAVGGVTLEILKDIAVAYVKQAAAEKLGITLS